MLILAIDTSTPDMVVGLSDGARVLAERILPDTRHHAELLIPTVLELLGERSLADVTALVVGQGPGPFTGLRVGMATAEALGQALGVPVHGVVSHDAIAHRLGGGDVLVVTDARRREMYWSRYRDGQRVGEPRVSKPAEVADAALSATRIAVPDHLAVLLPAGEKQQLNPDTAALVAVADLTAEPQPLVPYYLRRPDAVPPRPVAPPRFSDAPGA